MNIQIEPILIEQKSVFIQLMNLYLYDFTEYTNDDIDNHGYFFDYSRADGLWIDTKLHPFFIRVDDKLAGFMIIANSGRKYINDENAQTILEFFVMKKYRRNGVGRFAARTAFDMFKGKWEVCQMQNNFPARKFWKSIISEYTKNDYQECGTENDSLVGFIFDNSHTAK